MGVATPYALPLVLGLVVVGLVVRSRRRASRDAAREPKFGRGWDPACRRYPGGNWAAEYGHGWLEGSPKGAPGWTQEDSRRIVAITRAAVESAPQWESLPDAREISFQLTRSIIAGLCPGRKLPESQVQVEQYMDKSLALRWMWGQVENLVWNDLVNAEAGG